EYFKGLIDEVRVYGRALSPSEIQTDMNTPVSGNADTQAPAAAVTAPGSGATLSGTVSVSANATDNVGVAGGQFYVDGSPLGAEDTAAPYSVSWDTTSLANGAHTLTARAHDAAGNSSTSAPISVTIDNTPPTVASVSPGNSATQVGVGGSVFVTFSE